MSKAYRVRELDCLTFELLRLLVPVEDGREEVEFVVEVTPLGLPSGQVLVSIALEVRRLLLDPRSDHGASDLFHPKSFEFFQEAIPPRPDLSRAWGQ